MRRKYIAFIIGIVFSIVLFGVSSSQVLADDFKDIPVKDMITMLDLGSKSCIPCKMMEPVLEKVKKDYKDKAAVIFIDVWQHRSKARQFGIQAIPTQIFFNKDGEEIYRHVGFMNEKAIVEQLKKMGVQKVKNISNK